MGDPIYAVCVREGLKVDMLGFYRNRADAEAEVARRNKNNWESYYYVGEIDDLG